MATSNDRGVQRELSALSCESNSTNNSSSVFNTPSLSKSSSVCEIGDTFKSSKNFTSYNNLINTNIIANESFKDEIIVLNNSLKNNIINNSFETNNKSDIFNYNLPQPTFAQFGRNLSVDQVEYFLEFQEYPKTSPTGVASPDKAKQAFGIANLQYSYGNPGNTRLIQKCPFLGVPVHKTYRSCHSVKVCEFSSPELNIEHTSVDFEDQLYKKIFEISNITLDIQKFIGYNKYKLGEKGHRFIPINQRVNLNYLEQLFHNYTYCSDGINEEDRTKVIDKCYTVLLNSSMTAHCPFLHKTNNQIIKAKIINKGNCPVKFYHIIPNNLAECPFIVMISIGIHNHPPPPAIKTPRNIIENLQTIIYNEYDLDLTARKLLTRPMIKMYLQGKPLSSIHSSLNNQSRLNYLIEKNKRSKYPFGQDII
ncbi:6308_t:CDS:2, partial [Cetraspora pellucida]